MSNARGHRKIARAKRAVTLGVVLFAAFQLSLLFVVEFWQPLVVDPEYGYRLERLRELRRTYPQNRSLVVLGSSRIGNGFEADYLNAAKPDELPIQPETAFNLSLTGGFAVWQYLVLQRLIDNQLKPDAVVIEVFPAALMSDKQYFADTFHFPTHRLRWRDTYSVADLMPEQSTRHRAEWLWNNALFPWHAHRFAILGQCIPKFQVELNNPNSRPDVWNTILSPAGWIAFGVKEPTVEQRKEAELLANKTYASHAKDVEVADEIKNTYFRLLNCCREHGIQVQAVVLMPEGSKFRSWYTPESRDNIAKFCQSLVDNFDVPIVDARDWIEDEKFWDSHHLLESGAREFTARFRAESLALGEPTKIALPHFPTRR
jgi:hypothetical protein